jgi:modulator of FtsH protease HflC
MPMKARIILVGAVVLLAFLSSCLYVVDETQQVVITQLGKPVGKPVTTSGLNFKWPVIQKANYFEKRVMKWDGNPNQIPTRDKKYIWVDTTARWRIVDPLLFLMRVGNEQTAHSRLDGIIDSVVRDHVSDNDLVELVRSEGWEMAKQTLQEVGIPDMPTLEPKSDSSAGADTSDHMSKGREVITREMVADASRLLPEFGIHLLDLRIKRIKFVDSVQQKVFERMISERKRIASQYRSEGEGERAATLGRMEKELARINSEAFRKSQEIRGKADAEATRIYAETFGKNTEFFEFYRTMEFYREFNNSRSSFVLTTEADVFKYLKGSGEPHRK